MSNKRILERGTIAENLLEELHWKVGDGGEPVPESPALKVRLFASSLITRSCLTSVSKSRDVSYIASLSVSAIADVSSSWPRRFPLLGPRKHTSPGPAEQRNLVLQ
jgi:hypothetical protein